MFDRLMGFVDGDVRLPTLGYANGYWWVRAGSIEILELFGIEFINPPLRTRTGEYLAGGSIDRVCGRSISRDCRGGFMLEIIAKFQKLGTNPPNPTSKYRLCFVRA
jgi:hypothetical protein